MSALSKLPSLPALLLAAVPLHAAEEAASPRAPQSLRYQAVAVGNGRILVIDTATGQCWSKSLVEGKWRDEGNPAESRSPNATTSLRGMTGDHVRKTDGERRSPVDDGSLNLTVRQRDRTAIPGKSLFVHIGDITEGQVLVSVRDANGKTVASETSLSVNEGLVFEQDGTTHELSLESLTNLLTGEDFAEFRLEATTRANDPGRPSSDSGYESPERRRDGLPRSDSARNPPEQRRTKALRSDPVRAAPDPAAEARKIEALIEHVEGMTDAKFVRNGIEYDGPTAAAFLRGKWDANKAEIATAADFIDKAATASSASGQPYLIRLKDGSETNAAEYLHAELDRLADLPR